MADSTTPTAGGYYPPVGFHFKVEFQGIGNDNDIRFQSVSGLTMEYESETIKEGGQNLYEHKLPVRSKFSDLVLKRGMLTDSEVIKWCTKALYDREFEPAQIVVTLINEKDQPLRTWAVNNAWPRKWTISDLNATENSVVVETLEISYSYFTVK